MFEMVNKTHKYTKIILEIVEKRCYDAPSSRTLGFDSFFTPFDHVSNQAELHSQYSVNEKQ